MTPQQFAEKYGKEALSATDGTSIFALVVLGAAALESGYAKSGLSSKYNNFFGIKKSSSWRGKVVTMRTREVIDGKEVYINAQFKHYDTAADSFRDYIATVTRTRYVNAGVLSAENAAKQIQAIKDGGYATDPDYVGKVVSVMNKLSPYLPADASSSEKKN